MPVSPSYAICVYETRRSYDQRKRLCRTRYYARSRNIRRELQLQSRCWPKSRLARAQSAAARDNRGLARWRRHHYLIAAYQRGALQWREPSCCPRIRGFADGSRRLRSPDSAGGAAGLSSTAGYDLRPVMSMGGLRIVPDQALARLSPQNTELLILPGGDVWEAGYPADVLDPVLGRMRASPRAGRRDLRRYHCGSARWVVSWTPG